MKIIAYIQCLCHLIYHYSNGNTGHLDVVSCEMKIKSEKFFKLKAYINATSIGCTCGKVFFDNRGN